MGLSKDWEHASVLIDEAVGYLNVSPGKRYIDSTVGGGGHLEALLDRGAEVLGIDQDPTSLNKAEKRLLTLKTFKLIQGNFSHIGEIASRTGFTQVDGILFDLGFASFQIDDPARGLSILENGPLDMRLDPTLAIKAGDIVNDFPEKQLERLLRDFGDEPKARLIAREIVNKREEKRLTETHELKNLIERVYGRQKLGNAHCATRTFQALRIAVNGELENLKTALPQALDLLKPGGRLVVISFHSGEDRIVKNLFKEWEREEKVKVLTKKPFRPEQAELEKNSRARSALLRALEKI